MEHIFNKEIFQNVTCKLKSLQGLTLTSCFLFIVGALIWHGWNHGSLWSARSRKLIVLRNCTTTTTKHKRTTLGKNIGNNIGKKT